MKILAFGGAGLVGSRFIQLTNKTFDIFAPDISEVDILDKDQINKAFDQFAPTVSINFAAFTDVQGAEKQKGDKSGSCYRVNVEGAGNVARICQESGAHLIHVSTDYVFDGEKGERPYTEEDIPNPINWYGQTKYLAEKAVLESGASVTVMRISMPYAAHYDLKKDIARNFLERFRKKEQISAIDDQKITPTLVDDIANALAVLIENKPSGIYQVCAKNWTTPFDFATLIGRIFSFDRNLVKPISLEEYNKGKEAPLLKYSWLDPSKFEKEFGEDILHSIEEGIEIFKRQVDEASLNQV